MSGTSLNINSGAKTRWTNIFAGVFVAVIILIFEQMIGLIPMPALAGLVLLAGFQSLKIPAAITVWQTGKVPAVAMALTFGLTLTIPLQYAVLVGVAFAVMLYVIRQSNQVQVVQIVPVPDGLPLEAPPPPELPKNQVTILMIFGSVFFAASQTIEESFPSADHTDHAVVILGLRGHAEVGSTFINSLWRYADSLKAHNSKLMLVGINQEVRQRLLNTGFIQAIGEENVFSATPQLGEALNKALAEASKWIDRAPELRINLT
jgi:SulP family sulfate permease